MPSHIYIVNKANSYRKRNKTKGKYICNVMTEVETCLQYAWRTEYNVGLKSLSRVYTVGTKK